MATTKSQKAAKAASAYAKNPTASNKAALNNANKAAAKVSGSSSVTPARTTVIQPTVPKPVVTTGADYASKIARAQAAGDQESVNALKIAQARQSGAGTLPTTGITTNPNDIITKAKADYAAAQALGDQAGMAAAHARAEAARAQGGTIPVNSQNATITQAKAEYAAAEAAGDQAGMAAAHAKAEAARAQGGNIPVRNIDLATGLPATDVPNPTGLTAQLRTQDITTLKPIMTEVGADVGFTGYDPAMERLKARYRAGDTTLTPEERSQLNEYLLDQIVSEKPKDPAANIQSAFDIIRKSYEDQAASEQKAYLETQKQEEIDNAAKFTQYNDTLNESNQMAREDERLAGEDTKENTRRLLAFNGFGRSTEMVNRLDAVDRSVNSRIRAIDAAQSAQAMLYQAQLEGASDDKLQKMEDRVQQLKDKATEIHLSAITAVEEARIKAEEKNDAENLASLAALSQQISPNKKPNEGLSKLMRYLVDDYGIAITGADGKVQPVATDGSYQAITGNDPFTGQPVFGGTFNKDTGQYSGATGFSGSLGAPTVNSTSGSQGGAFYTAGGKQRWGYTAMSNEEWLAKSPEEKDAFITYMNKQEGGPNNRRTSANNNPTAFTTAVAKELGLVEGVDYVRGDVWSSNPNMFTARLLGDGRAVTIKGLDMAAGSGSSNGNDSSENLIAEARRNGYLSKDEVQGYVYARKNGAPAAYNPQAEADFKNSPEGKQIQGIVELDTAIKRLIDYGTKNGFDYVGKNSQNIKNLSSSVAIAYKKAQELGALVGADWRLVDSIAPDLSLGYFGANAIANLASGRNKETFLTGLKTGLKSNENLYKSISGSVNPLYTPILQKPAYKLATSNVATFTGNTRAAAIKFLKDNNISNPTEQDIQFVLNQK